MGLVFIHLLSQEEVHDHKQQLTRDVLNCFVDYMKENRLDNSEIYILVPGEVREIPIYRCEQKINISKMPLPSQGLDELSRYFDDLLLDIYNKRPTEVVLNINSSMGPSICILMAKLADHFAGQYSCIQLSNSHFKKPVVNKVKFKDYLIKDRVKKIIENYLDTYDYNGLLALANKFNLSVKLKNIIQLGVKLRNFDLDGGDEKYLNILARDINKDYSLQKFSNFVEEIILLSRREQETFIKALFFSGEIEFRQKNYVDFLVRYLRLLEEIVLMTLGYDLDDRGYPYQKKEGPVNIYKDDINYFKLIKKLKRYVKENGEYSNVLDYLEQREVKNLVKLRHSSVSGHGFAVVSEEEINSIYSIDKILPDLEKVLEFININTAENYYRTLNQLILTFISDETKP